MLNVTYLIIKTMKKEFFPEEGINKAARQVLSELKTKYVDIREGITSEIQYKLLNKMKNERINSKEIYEKAYLNNKNENAKTNFEKADLELSVINILIADLEKELPKQLTESDIFRIFSENNFRNIGDCMKFFSINYPNQDKKLVSQLFKNNKIND